MNTETLQAELRKRERQLRVMDAAYLRLRGFVAKLAAYEDSYDPMQLQKMAIEALDDKELSNQMAIKVADLSWLKEGT